MINLLVKNITEQYKEKFENGFFIERGVFNETDITDINGGTVAPLLSKKLGNSIMIILSYSLFGLYNISNIVKPVLAIESESFFYDIQDYFKLSLIDSGNNAFSVANDLFTIHEIFIKIYEDSLNSVFSSGILKASIPYIIIHPILK